MASASAPPPAPIVEQCWVLLGQRRGRVWLARGHRRQAGERTRVAFDGPWVLTREELHGDVVGFYHTHPDGPHHPSRRDVRTMRAWCSAFRKLLLCLIAGPKELCGYRFDNDSSDARALSLVEQFPRGVIVAVE